MTLKCLPKRGAGARQSAHDRADGHLEDLRRLAVGEAFHEHEAHDRALFLRQPEDGLKGRLEFLSNTRDMAAVGACDVINSVQHLRSGEGAARPNLVNPVVLHDLEEPAVQSGVRPPGPKPKQSPLDGRLYEVVGVVLVSCKRKGEASQTREKLDDMLRNVSLVGQGFTRSSTPTPPPAAGMIGLVDILRLERHQRTWVSALPNLGTME